MGRAAPGAGMRPWLFRILRNAFLDTRRRDRHSPLVPDDDRAEERPQPEDGALRGDRELERLRGLVGAEIEAALRTLSEEARQVVLLDVEGLAEAEIAEVLGCAAGTVKSRLSRARAALRTRLADYRREEHDHGLRPGTRSAPRAPPPAAGRPGRRRGGPPPGRLPGLPRRGRGRGAARPAARRAAAAPAGAASAPGAPRGAGGGRRAGVAARPGAEPASSAGAAAAEAPGPGLPEARRRRGARDAVVGLALAAGLLLAGGALLVAQRAPGAGAAGPLAAEALSDHLRLLASAHPLDVPSTETHEVKPWFAGRIDFAPAVPAGGEGLELLGGSLGYFLDRKAAVIAYGLRRHRLTLLAFRADGLAWPAPDAEAGGVAATAVELRGFQVLLWRQGELGYALVSDVAAPDFRAAAARLAPATGGAGAR